MLERGIVGGSLISFEQIGTKAGELALDILRGTKTPEDIPAVLDVPPVPMFDWRQLRHWNLDEDALPQGSVVVNREFTLWSIRYYIIGVLAFCLAATALLVFLMVQMRRKNIAETGTARKPGAAGPCDGVGGSGHLDHEHGHGLRLGDGQAA